MKEKLSYLIISRPYVLEFNNNRGYIRTVFNISTGIKLLEVFDYIINQTTFSRKINNTKLTIKGGVVVSITKDINFNTIYSTFGKISSKQSWIPNPNFGVLDLETYKDLDGLNKVYAIGFSTLLEKHHNFFNFTDVSSNLDSNYLIIHCIDSMLVSKYHNYFFYRHNLGKFDVVLFIKYWKNLICTKTKNII